jgi:hypothetical protein
MDADGTRLLPIADSLSLPAGTAPEYYGRMRWELLFDWHD